MEEPLLILHLTTTYAKTFCGLAPAPQATISIKNYSWYREHAYTFCKKCENDPRIPLILLDSTDL